MAKRKKPRKKDGFDLLCEALKIYLAEEGWNLVVAGNPEIRQPSNKGKYNYEFVMKITASKRS